MDPLTIAVQLVAFAVGAILQFVLAAALLHKQRATFQDRILTLALACSALWFVSRATVIYGPAILPDSAFVSTLESAGQLAGLLAVALLAYVVMLWADLPRWAGSPLVVAAAGTWWLWSAEPAPAYAAFAVLAICGAAAGTALVYRRRPEGRRRRFQRAFALTLLIALPGVIMPESGLAAVLMLAPAVCITHFTYRYNLFDALIPRRAVFAVALGLFSAAYLFIVWEIGEFLEFHYDAFGPLVEVTLILGAALIWLPLYGWITGFFSRRAEHYATVCKQVIQRAVGILDPRARAQFLAEETGKAFDARRAVVHRSAEPRLDGTYECVAGAEFTKMIGKLEAAASKSGAELFHSSRARGTAVGGELEQAGFHYAIPLRHEDQVTGMLLLDITPRSFLDENEPILLGLSRQIAYSLEACRLVEEKIELEKALLKQEHLAALGRTAATIAHEVKNPLSSIKTLTQLMREDPEVTARYDRDLGFIISETDRLNKCVVQLLSFSRPALEEVSEVPVFDLIETTAETLKRETPANGVRIDSVIDPALHDVAMDRQQLQQVVLNLALNALEASPRGSTVHIEARQNSSDEIHLEVVDEGPGIRQEEQARIFEPFFTTKQKGSGLGLAIVKKNLRNLHGDIELSSPVQGGRGTRFTVTIPVAHKQEAPR